MYVTLLHSPDPQRRPFAPTPTKHADLNGKPKSGTWNTTFPPCQTPHVPALVTGARKKAGSFQATGVEPSAAANQIVTPPGTKVITKKKSFRFWRKE